MEINAEFLKELIPTCKNARVESLLRNILAELNRNKSVTLKLKP